MVCLPALSAKDRKPGLFLAFRSLDFLLAHPFAAIGERIGIRDFRRTRRCAAAILDFTMTAVISMLRGVNLAGRNKIKMEVLRELYLSLKLEDAATFIQSGNVVFRTKERNLGAVGKRIGDGIEKSFGFRPEVILRTAEEMRGVIARNPFAERKDVEPNKLLVWFLAGDPGDEARAKVAAIKADPEELRADGRELFIYFTIGMARPKLSMAAVERALKVSGTGRNWNSVLKLMEMAEKLSR